MTESSYRTCDVVLKVLAGIGFLMTFYFGIVQWNGQRDHDRDVERAAKDAERAGREASESAERARRERATATDFFNRAVSTYGDAVRVAGELANLDPVGDKAAFDANVRTFMSLYYGSMTFIESKSVESAMIDFHDAIPGTSAQRHDAALNLAHVARESLSDWSDLDLKKITADWNPSKRSTK